MDKTQDTIDGLLAEFRGYSAGMPPSYHVTMSWADFRRMLDRFDAAHKREKAAVEADALSVGGLVQAMTSPVGDCAKLREALKTVKRYLDGYTVNVLELRRTVDAALAAPPRNCDKYSHDEALNIWAAENENERNGCFDEWLYHNATEREGGAK